MDNFMQFALELAKEAEKLNEVPVGCVIVKDGKIIGKGFNKRETSKNALMHAEIIAIENACKNLESWRLENCDLYVTLEPCPMCAGAIINSRIKNLYFGAYDYKNGCCGSVINLFDLPFTHKVSFNGGIMQEDCSLMLSNFFKKLRK